MRAGRTCALADEVANGRLDMASAWAPTNHGAGGKIVRVPADLGKEHLPMNASGSDVCSGRRSSKWQARHGFGLGSYESRSRRQDRQSAGRSRQGASSDECERVGRVLWPTKEQMAGSTWLRLGLLRITEPETRSSECRP